MSINLPRVYYVTEDKSSVQDFYVSVIGRSFNRLGYRDLQRVSSSEIRSLDRNSIIIAISHYCVFDLFFKGFRNIVYWVQGSSPDESFMRNHSYLRKTIISLIELFALRHSKCIFMVSNALLEHYKQKYHIDFSHKTYIMPCYNDSICESSFHLAGKYHNNVFCYVGGLSIWQNFPETIDLFMCIQKRLPAVSLKVFTPDVLKAKSIIENKGLKNYSIDYVRPDQLTASLSVCKFGFIVRSKSPVNKVATPTKLSNYLAAGVIPVVSDSVGFFNEVLKDKKYSILLTGNTENDVESVIHLCTQNIDANEVFKEYSDIYSTYYNTDSHIIQISSFLNCFWPNTL